MKGRTTNSAYRYGGGPHPSYVKGVQSGNHSNPKVMQEAKASGGCVDGKSAKPRLDRPARKAGGRVCKADGGRMDKAQGWVADATEADSARAERKSGGRIGDKARNWADTSAEKESERAEDDDHLAKGGKAKWIQGMNMKKGALHKELGVPEGEKIPAKKLDKAAHSDNPLLRKRANLAKTLKGMHK